MAVPLHPARLRSQLDSVMVWTAGDVPAVPPAVPPPGYRLREMDMEDDADVRRWLTVHNTAFQRSWGFDDYRRAVLDHPDYDVRRTLLVERDGRPVASTSAGVFRRNPQIGLGHYLAVVPSDRRHGIARMLLLRSYRAVLEFGTTNCEAETPIGRSPSLILQFAIGLRPKLERDSWNPPDRASPLMRSIANARLQRLYRRSSARAREAAGHA